MNNALHQDLLHDVRVIANLVGEMRWSSEARSTLAHWHREGEQPIPEHPKLMHYATRRLIHLTKICMVSSISRGNDFIVTIDDYQRAMDWLLEAEHFMPDIFKAMHPGGDGALIDECWYYCVKKALRTQRPIPEMKIVHYLMAKAPAHSVMRLIAIMTGSGLLSIVGYDGNARKLYKPKGRDEMV